MKSKLLIGFLIYAMGIGTICYMANPHFYYFNKDYFKILDRPSIAPATRYKELNSSCKATAQYRYNDNRTGVAPKEYQPSLKPEIKKRIRPFNVGIHSASKASPTIDDSGIYVGSDTGWFWKLNHDGEVIWEFYIPGSGNGIHGSAAIDEKKVFIGAYNGFLYALDKMSGELVWANPVGDFVGASPLLANGHVYIAAETSHPNGLVAKLDCNTGETQWVSQWLHGHSHSSPSYDENNDQILVGANSGFFFAFDDKTGKTNWKLEFKGQIKGTPLIKDGVAYFSSWDKHYHAVNTATGKIIWSRFVGGRNQSSLSLVPDHNIGIANTKVGDIIGLNLKDGEILWRLRHGDKNHMFSVLITHNKDKKRPYIAWSRCKVNKLCLLDAITGKLIHHIELPGSFTSVPYAYKDKVYISLDKKKGFIILQ